MSDTAVILAADGILAAGLGLILLLEVRHHVNHPRGQVLVEMALALPVLLFITLGLLEAGSLLIAKADEDHNVRVVADWAAAHPSEPPGPVVHAVGSIPATSRLRPMMPSGSSPLGRPVPTCPASRPTCGRACR